MNNLDESKISALEEIPTLIIPSVRISGSNLSYKLLVNLPKPLQHLTIIAINRMGDVETEICSANQQNVTEPGFVLWRWLSVLVLMSCGVGLVAYTFASSRNGVLGLRPFLYIGLFLIFAPTALWLVTPLISRIERILLLCIVGIYCYCIKVMFSPLTFSMYDEFLHLRTAEDIARSGHLFSTNPLLPVSSYYPGLEIVTNAVSTLSGLDIFHSGLIVIGIGRLLLILAFFALNERIFQSHRIASIATLLYMTNPRFIFFDAQFAYESLALPISVFLLFVISPYQWLSDRLTRFETVSSIAMLVTLGRKKVRDELVGMSLAASSIIIALEFTHHVTDFFLDGLLMLWVVVYVVMRLAPIYRSLLTWITLLGVLLSITWMVFQGNPVIGYLTLFFRSILNHPRQLFASIPGTERPLLWEQIAGLFSVMLILFCLSLGLLCVWRRYRSHIILCVFGIISIFYPISQLFRFTSGGAQIAGRASVFIFIAIAPVLAVFITQFWPIRRLNWLNTSLIACFTAIMFVGGFILEGGGIGLSSLPGPYEVVADARSIEPEGIQASMWASVYLGHNNRIATDRINQILMGTYGNQRVVTTLADHIDIAPVFFSQRFGPGELVTLSKAHVHYLLVDLRLAQSFPEIGYYFTPQENGAYRYISPINVSALMKFNFVPQVNRIFDDGNIVIYDVGGLTRATKKF